jgi:hypothetical protein
MVTSSPRFRTEERNRASRTTQRANITRRINASGTISWCVDLGLVNGKRKRHFYKTKQEAQTKADQFKIARTNLGTAAFSLTDKQRVDATEALSLLAPVNVSLVQACRYYLKHAKPARPLAVKEAIASFLEAKRRAGRRPVYLKNLSYILHTFRRHFGDRPVNDVTHEEIGAWVLPAPEKRSRRSTKSIA